MAAALPRSHAFLCYVREDIETVERVQAVLEAAGIPVWRDRDSLWPGEDWKLKIREAIRRGAFAFIPFFSDASLGRETSYQYEELLLAIEELRLRAPDRPWLIPVRLSDCEPPDYDLGGGRTLSNLQRADLFGDNWDIELGRLVGSVLRIVGGAENVPAGTESRAVPASDVRAQIKSVLLEPTRQIDLEDRIRSHVREAVMALSDPELFPVQSPHLDDQVGGLRYLVDQANRYRAAVAPLLDILAIGCAYGEPRHDRLWAEIVQAVANTATPGSGQTALIDLRRYPMLLLLYTGAVAAVHRENFGALRALTNDARFRDLSETRPLIAASHVWRAFSHVEIVPQLLAFQADSDLTDELIAGLRSGRTGKRYTPISDHLHVAIREPLRELLPDDRDYTETFDRTEVLLALIATDVRAQLQDQGLYADGPWFGSFTWRDRYGRPTPEEKLRGELDVAAEEWPPLRGNLFGGDAARAGRAFDAFIPEAAKARSNRW